MTVQRTVIAVSGGNLGEFVLQVTESVFESGGGEKFISALMDTGN